MARSRYGFDEAKIERFQKEGRGTGSGPSYEPWIKVQDVPSRGRSHRFPGRITGRIHHLLSDLEFRTFLIYDWSEAVTDIREQFPLDRKDTRRIAETMGVRHPTDRQTRVDLVMTTDLVIDMMKRGKPVTVVRAVKPAKELEEKRTIEKLEIERRYWAEKNVDWGIVTESELPKGLVTNLTKLVGYREIDVGPIQGIVDMIDREHPAWAGVTLREFADAMDVRFALEDGRALAIILHLLATGRWVADLSVPIDEITPLARFARRRSAAASSGRETA